MDNVAHSPDYKKIFTDMIKMKYQDKEKECEKILAKKSLSYFDILIISDKIVGKSDKKKYAFNQQHKSYSKKTIIEILKFQRKNSLNNSELARKMKMSRNTIRKWKLIFKV